MAVLDTAGRCNGDQNHIWVIRYCQNLNIWASTNIILYTSYFPGTGKSKYDSTFILRLRKQTRFTEDAFQDNLGRFRISCSLRNQNEAYRLEY